MTGEQPADKTAGQFGYVYVARCARTGLVKIGSARKPLTRMKALSKEMCSAVVMLHTIATNAALRLEREAQRRFLDSHKGGEWFELSGEEVALLCAVSTVFYKDVPFTLRDKRRAAFDSGAKWAAGLPVCGAA